MTVDFNIQAVLNQCIAFRKVINIVLYPFMLSSFYVALEGHNEFSLKTSHKSKIRFKSLNQTLFVHNDSPKCKLINPNSHLSFNSNQ